MGVEQSSSVVIRRSPAEVWDFVSDLAATPQWRTTVTSIEPPVSLEVGQRFSGTTRVIGKTWRWELELTEVEPGERLGYVVVRGVVKPRVVYLLEPHDDGTRFTLTGAVDQLGIAGRLLAPAAVPALRRETAAHVENLRTILEKSGGNA